MTGTGDPRHEDRDEEGETVDEGGRVSQSEEQRGWGKLLRAAVVFFVAAFGFLGAVIALPGDLPGFWQSLPWVGAPPLKGALRIVVAPIAIDAPKKADEDEEVAEAFGDALLEMVADEFTEPGVVAVGGADNDDVGVYRTEAGRAERLGTDLSSRRGHIAVSATLIPGVVDRLRVEIYLDRHRLGEAYELGGLQSLSEAEFGDVADNPSAHRNAQNFLLGKVRLYSRMLMAAGDYATGDERGLKTSIKEMRALQPDLTGAAERSFSWLLIGNAEARAHRRHKAEAAYRSALDADPGSVRAKLGLAEITYLRAGGTFSGQMCTREVSREKVLDELEGRYEKLAGEISQDDRHDVRPRIHFALARTRLCLLLIRGKGPIDRIEMGFRTAAASWENDTRKIWLRTLTADSYALLGEISMLALVDRAPDPATAARYFEAAARLAPDEARRTAYHQRDEDVRSP
ncbi:tetratricopeptide repeat protein [Actinocorallia herbida]|uniref:tetratricopeptide repeat protein n=1 Tax=Actinocorallia herbida TaxID=58109 RepID=UPI0011CE6602|nr:hypothetical protein [Actinocorallia herbida]